MADFNIIGSYIENVPTIIISLYLGIYLIISQPEEG